MDKIIFLAVWFCKFNCIHKNINYNHLIALSFEELTHWKGLWCWEGLGAGGEGDDRGWDGWMASLTRWTWVSVNSGSWWWTGRPGVLRFMGSQRVGHDWVTDLIWSDVSLIISPLPLSFSPFPFFFLSSSPLFLCSFFFFFPALISPSPAVVCRSVWDLEPDSTWTPLCDSCAQGPTFSLSVPFLRSIWRPSQERLFLGLIFNSEWWLYWWQSLLFSQESNAKCCSV